MANVIEYETFYGLLRSESSILNKFDAIGKNDKVALHELIWSTVGIDKKKRDFTENSDGQMLLDISNW